MTAISTRLRWPDRSERPERDVPPELAARIRPYLDESVHMIIEEIQHEIPEFARPLDSGLGQRLQRGVKQALQQFWDQIENPETPHGPLIDIYRDIGRAELREGRSLDVLQSALRIGARVALRRLAYNRDLLDIPPDTLFHVANAIFLHLDELASASAQGYSEAQAERAGEQERRRRRLLQLLLTEPPPVPDALADQARAAAWQLPGTAAAVVLETGGVEELRTPPLPREVLVDLNWPETYLVVPDPDGPGRQQMINSALRGWEAAIGPAVPLDDLAKSLRRAKQALKLGRRGIIDNTCVIRCADHMSTLAIFADEELVGSLAEMRLAPLTGLRSGQQERLAETLLTWLQHGCNASEVASRLYLHPQTVRYRLRQIRELFGDQLSDPTRRFELEIVLRARQLRRAEVATPAQHQPY